MLIRDETVGQDIDVMGGVVTVNFLHNAVNNWSLIFFVRQHYDWKWTVISRHQPPLKTAGPGHTAARSAAKEKTKKIGAAVVQVSKPV